MTVIRLPGSLSPERNECLPCFLARVLARVGCAGTFEWTKEWRAVRSPRATSLEDRLSSLGAECDCLVLAHLYQPQLMLWTRSAAGGAQGRRHRERHRRAALSSRFLSTNDITRAVAAA